jgi:site-specific DNA recombinase
MCGKTRQGPLRPRLRAQRGRRLQPRRAVSSSAVPPEEWLTIPVPAIVEADPCAAVQEPLRANQRHARQSRRGALSLRQGLVPCQPCGAAFYGKRISHKAAKGHPRAYAYDRCLGTDADRFGGERVCRHTQVRTDLLDLAGWREVCGLLAHPERLAAEYRRRLQPHEPARGTEYTLLEAQLGKLRQGLARLIDSYAEGLLENHAFEPRIARLRQRLTHLEAQRQQLADDAAVQTELQLIIGRLEDFAARVHAGLEEADWPRQREMIRALVKRVEVDHDQVPVVFRVDQQPGDLDAEKKSLQDCRGSQYPALWCAECCISKCPLFHHACAQEIPDKPEDLLVFDSPPKQTNQLWVVYGVKVGSDISLDDPEIFLAFLGAPGDALDCIHGTTCRAESKGVWTEIRFKNGL